jgi:class 3 adenylate cyclase
MPLFMDIHTVDGATAKEIADAHLADVGVQDRYQVEYLKYWFNEECGKLFCLVEAPSAEAAHCVHEEAHGLVAEKVIEVHPELVEGFLGMAPVSHAGAALLPNAVNDDQRDTGVRSILFTDIVNSTETTSRFGDDAIVAILSVHDRVVRHALRDNGGREVKHTGDGIMAVFISAVDAVRFACQVQGEMRAYNERGPDHPIMVRIGISAGEPIEQDDDLFGSTVQLAARLCAHAEPGHILVSNAVAGLCAGADLKFTEAREVQLKGFSKAVETHFVDLTC